MTTRMAAQAFAVESVELDAPLKVAFDYIANTRKLPEWTHAFKAVREGHAVMQTPDGTVEVGLEVRASEQQGTIDWYIKFPDGNVAAAYSRLVPQNTERVVYSFILLAPPVPLEQLEGALSQQAVILRDELRKLSTSLGGGYRNGSK
jgi:hypothetical protein